MANINRLYATIRLVLCALFPHKGAELKRIHPELIGTTSITAEDFAVAFADINSLLRPDNRLELLFEGALSPAATILLYRLKSSGFSGCRAIASAEGILLTAIR